MTSSFRTCCLWFWQYGFSNNCWAHYKLSSAGKNRVSFLFRSWNSQSCSVTVNVRSLFNLFINDLMFLSKEKEFCNFANDTTIYSCSLNYKEAHRKLPIYSHIVPNWFRINSMVTNPSKTSDKASRVINKW